MSEKWKRKKLDEVINEKLFSKNYIKIKTKQKKCKNKSEKTRKDQSIILLSNSDRTSREREREREREVSDSIPGRVGHKKLCGSRGPFSYESFLEGCQKTAAPYS